MKTSILRALLIVLILFFTQGALAEEVRFVFSGHLTIIDDPHNVLDGTGITTASTFTGTITYDSDACPTYEHPEYAEYPGTLLRVTIDNNYTVQTWTPEIQVVNDGRFVAPPDYIDMFFCHSSGDVTTNLPADITHLVFAISKIFQPPDPSPLASCGLPLTLDLNDFPDVNPQEPELQQIEIYGPDFSDSLRIGGELDTLDILDGDLDGVPDHLDLCPATPEGTTVKTNGCVEGDYNNDGNIDGSDLAEFSDRFGM